MEIHLSMLDKLYGIMHQGHPVFGLNPARLTRVP